MAVRMAETVAVASEVATAVTAGLAVVLVTVVAAGAGSRVAVEVVRVEKVDSAAAVMAVGMATPPRASWARPLHR